MIIEHPVPMFAKWIGPAALTWLLSLGILIGVFELIRLVFLLSRNGLHGFTLFFTTFFKGIDDFCFISWRRVWAITKLIIRESIRKKVVVVCIVFLVLLMFASWFLNPNTTDPAKTYVSFVFQSTTYLVILLALFLSSLSLPADFKNKTIFTIVTKPIRPSEIILGRILGLTIIGTVILCIMSIASYLFVTNSLSHTHRLNEREDLTPVASADDPRNQDGETVIAKGTLQLSNGHKHNVEEYVRKEGDKLVYTFNVSQENNHTHSITREVDGDNVRYIVGPEQGTVQAKVPVYGNISFRDASNYERSRGINVGEEWTYRSYVAGATSEAVIWTFDHLDASKYPDGLPIEMSISVFRTTLGNIESTIMGSILVRNPKTGLTAETNVFNSEKYITKALMIPRTIEKSKVESQPRALIKKGMESSYEPLPGNFVQKDSYDLFEDFVDDGKLEIWLQCIERGQYFGAAQYDLYLRDNDANVLVNFFKGYLGIWQQMIFVIAFGVLFSTFLSGPVAMVSTFGIVIAATFKSFFMEIANLNVLGGGPIESLNRLITHESLMIDLPNVFSTSLIKFFDMIASALLWIIGNAIPSFSNYTIYMDYVATGYNIPFNTILVHLVTTLSYVIPLFIAGYLILKNREIAK